MHSGRASPRSLSSSFVWAIQSHRGMRQARRASTRMAGGYEYLQLLACQRAGRTNAFSATCSACWLMGQSTFWALPPIPRGARSTSCFPPNRRGGEVPQPRACRRHVAGSDKSAGTSGEEARRHCQRAPGAAHTSLDRARGALDIGAMVRRLGRHRAKARTGPARRGRHAERARK